MVETARASNLGRGDAAAKRDDWATATTEWSRALRGPDRSDAQARLTWFLEQHEAIERPVVVESRMRKRAYLWVVVATIGAIAGTILVLINVNMSGGPGPLLSSAAWVAYIIAMAATLIFARRIGQAGQRADHRTGDTHVADHARSLARSVDRRERSKAGPRRRSSQH